MLTLVKAIPEFAHRLAVRKGLISLPELRVTVLQDDIEKEPASRIQIAIRGRQHGPKRIWLKKLVETVVKANNGMNPMTETEMADIGLQKLASPQAFSGKAEHRVVSRRYP